MLETSRDGAGRLHSLTVLRFAAASWVMLFHLNHRLSALHGGWLGNVLDHGYYAMPLFFILSGIVLVQGYRRLDGANDVVRFYLARFARLYPIYAWVHLLALIWYRPETAGWANWVYVNGLSLLGLQSWFSHAFRFGINSGTWSISVEIFFYLLFPALLPLLTWLRPRLGTAALVTALLAASAAFGWSDYIFGSEGTLIYYVLPLQRLPEFALGVVLGLALLERPAPSRQAWAAALLGGAAFLLVIGLPWMKWFGGSWIRYHGIVIPCAAWLLFGVARLEQLHPWNWELLPWRILRYLGESSYALFLSHLLLLQALGTPAGLVWCERLAARGLGPEAMLLGALVSLAGAIILHEAVEKPVRRLLLRRWPAYSATLMPLRK